MTVPARQEMLASVEAEIGRSLEDLTQRLDRHFAGQVAAELSGALAGGKRMRPLLCCWGYGACGGSSPEINRAAATLELLHTFAILHDDIMDDAGIRRQKPALYARIAGERRQQGKTFEADRFGISVAMLTGDLALVVSDAMFAELEFEPDNLRSAWRALTQMRLDALAGQYLDLYHSGAEFDVEMASRIARLKSGSYSVRGPLAVGAALAGAGGSATEALHIFGEAAGEAFQLTDDLLGMLGDPRATGKDPNTDLRQGKPTVLVAHALALASAESKSQIRAAWGNPFCTDEEIAAAREAIKGSGGVEATVEATGALITRAKGAIADPGSSGLDPEWCGPLVELADDLSARAQGVL